VTLDPVGRNVDRQAVQHRRLAGGEHHGAGAHLAGRRSHGGDPAAPDNHPGTAPIKRTETALDVINALRYNTSNASDANLAELQQCLQKFPSVQGIDFSDVSDNG